MHNHSSQSAEMVSMRRPKYPNKFLIDGKKKIACEAELKNHEIVGIFIAKIKQKKLEYIFCQLFAFFKALWET